jgi:aldehyde:ferredoxin oxidoreductase
MNEAASSTQQKALALNRDSMPYGTFAEIGAGQEVARWFFHVGGAAGRLFGEVDRLRADPNRGTLVAASEDFAVVLDSMIICKFLRKCFTDFYSEGAELLSKVTGWDCSGTELRRIGERIHTLKKLFNMREGRGQRDITQGAEKGRSRGSHWSRRGCGADRAAPCKGEVISSRYLFS